MIVFSCPACGFRVFNRRHVRCEGCGAELPAELLLSDEEVELRTRREAKRRLVDTPSPPRRSGWKGVVDDLVKPIPEPRNRWWFLNWPFWP